MTRYSSAKRQGSVSSGIKAEGEVNSENPQNTLLK